MERLRIWRPVAEIQRKNQTWQITPSVRKVRRLAAGIGGRLFLASGEHETGKTPKRRFGAFCPNCVEASWRFDKVVLRKARLV